MKQKYDAVIFDLDGTLLNTLDDLADSVNVVLTRANMPVLEKDQIRSFVGNGVKRLMEQCVPQGKDNPEFERIFREFKEYYSQHCNDRTAPYPGILDLLDALRERGVLMGIVSNKYYDAVQQLRELYFADTIKTAMGEREDIRRKPAPDSVLWVQKQLNCDTGRAVLVGDSEVDILTADHAGIDCIAVTWGFREREQLERAGGKQFADSPEEILEYF